MKSPLLTIAIPTWNRAAFLRTTLEQLAMETETVPAETVEVLVSDNASTDSTAEVIAAHSGGKMQLRELRNDLNLGSDANIAQCFNRACGKYVLILGDDDVIVDGALRSLIEYLLKAEYGVVCLRPYGFDQNFRQEHPGSFGSDEVFSDAGEFICRTGALVTLISACVINRSLLAELDARQFCGSNLVQVHLVIRAALAAQANLFINRYLIACRRNNSGGYDFMKVFVTNLGEILDQYVAWGLSKKAVRRFEGRLLLSYFPYYVFRLVLADSSSEARRIILATFERRFHARLQFRIWIHPILVLPHPFGLAWGGLATVLGRILGGDLRRGLAFARNLARFPR